MLSRILVARGVRCLGASNQLAQTGAELVRMRSHRMFSSEANEVVGEVSEPTVTETKPEETIVQNDISAAALAAASEATESTTTSENSADSSVEKTNETPSEAAPGDSEADKQFIQNLLSSLSVETKTKKERKQLVYDFATIMMDPSFKQLFNSLSKSLPRHYFDDHGMLPIVKKEFIARIQEEIIEGSFVEPEPDSSTIGLREKKRDIVKDNKVINTAEDDLEPPSLPIPSWILDDLNIQTEQSQAHQEKATKEAEARAAERAEEIKRVREVYDANRNNAIEEMLDTFGVWPLREKTVSNDNDNDNGGKEGAEKEEGKTKLRKYIQVTKDGARVAYGGGKRKNAIARVFVKEGSGEIRINGQSLLDYFPMGNNRDQVLAPLAVTMSFQKWNIYATVTGGGTTGQSEAIRLALAKAISRYQNTYAPILSKAGLLTSDTRRVERKKPGRRKARRPQQWVKR